MPTVAKGETLMTFGLGALLAAQGQRTRRGLLGGRDPDADDVLIVGFRSGPVRSRSKV